MLIKESFHDVKTSYGTTLRLFVYTPSIPGYPKAKFPGVLVYSEIYQVTGPVSRVAQQIAGRGYIVVAPSIYHNFVGPEPLAYDVAGTDDGNKYKIEKPLESYDEDNKLAIDYLTSLDNCTGRIGATGMCLGGHLAFRAALDKRVTSVFTFFATDIHSHSLGLGKNDDSLKRSNEFNKCAEFTLVFGTKDNHVPPEGRDLIRKTLRDNGVFFSFLEVAGAQHAFIRDESSKGRYDPVVTGLCMDMLFDQFYRNLVVDLGVKGDEEKVEDVC
ncbi:putative carboxymethylenebutenolidase [Yarrowia sp. C11]|nr:putative carboxymethylenebutenolidase [Yarrowia sp. E02]KAG5365266.1 putative carboxymethylenebutenolidase [Yarrowia sp. C11]